MIATDLQELLRTRRSTRRFLPEPVPTEVIQRLVETACHAPSAHNSQPWRFKVITSERVKSCLAEAMGRDFRRDLAADGVAEEQIAAQLERSRSRILGAPVVIILCMDMTGTAAYPDSRRLAAERMMAVQSVAAAGTQLLLSAHAEGLGAVWVCSPLFAPQTVREVLELPLQWEPQAMYFVGLPAEEPRPKHLKTLAEIALFEEG